MRPEASFFRGIASALLGNAIIFGLFLAAWSAVP